MRHYLKKPQGKRKSFSIYVRTINLDGTTNNKNLDNKDIEAIDAKFKSGHYSFKEAITHAEALCLRLNIACGAEEKKEQPQLYNLRLLEKYWRDEYSFREIKDEKGAYNKLRRAIEAVGKLSIATADRKELQLAIKELEVPQAQKRFLASSLNQLLKYAKRDFTLTLPKKHRKGLPDHLTMEEFLQVLPNIPKECVQVGAWIAYAAGLRIGELLALESSSFVEPDQVVYVSASLDSDFEIVDPKNGVKRHAYIFDYGIEWVKVWDQYREECVALGHYNMTKILTLACKKTFPRMPNKHCSFHDLRHSYAINLIPDVGFDLTSQSMGNSIPVCQEYYAGLALSKQGISAIRMRVDQARRASGSR